MKILQIGNSLLLSVMSSIRIMPNKIQEFLLWLSLKNDIFIVH